MSWITANAVSIFQLPKGEFVNKSKFWQVVLFLLAIGAGIFAFILGYAYSRISEVSLDILLAPQSSD
jgi:hypothetical protein